MKDFLIRSQRFLRNVNISLRSRDIYARVRPGMAKIAPFPWIFQYKNNAQNESESWIFSPKWLLNMFGDVFHVSQDTRPWKITKSSKLLRFWKILGKNRPIFVKNGSRNFKSRYLRNTFVLSTFALIELWSWNLAKWYKWRQKIVGVHFLEFFISNLIFDTLTWFFTHFCEYGTEYHWYP